MSSKPKSAAITVCAAVVLALFLMTLPSSPRSGGNGSFPLGPAVSVRNAVDPFDYFDNSWALIGLKDYPDATRISPDGRFLLGGQTACRFLVGESLVPLDSRVKRTLLKGYLPIVRYDFTVNETVSYLLEAFSCPMTGSFEGSSEWPDDPNFLNLIRITLRNVGDVPETAAFGFDWEGVGPLALTSLPGPGARALYAGEALASVFSSPPDVRLSAGKARITVEADLTAGESRDVVLCIPFHPLEKPGTADVPEMSRTGFEEQRDKTAAFWEGLLSEGAGLEIPESKPLESYMASLVYQFIGRDGGEVRAGEGFNDEFRLREGAYQAISFAYAGFLSEARTSLEAFAKYQTDDGQFLTADGRLDGNGSAVWALVEYGRLSGDTDWLARNFTGIERAVSFVRSARSRNTDRAFQGILPPAPAEGENLEDGRNHLVGNDFWNLRAVQEAAAAARLLGKKDEASALEREFEDYRAAILKAIDGTGLPYIPPSYETVGTHWGNLEAIFPSLLINPYDRRFTGTIENVHHHFGRGEGLRAGFIEGVIQWAPKTNTIHPQASLFVTNSHIIREEQDEALDGFYSFLLHSTSTQAFPERVDYLRREARKDTLPDLWAAALYVTTLRNMIIREEGENLHIFSAIPPGWLDPGKSIRFENVPTRFGKVSLSASAESDAIILNLTRPDRRDPERVLIHLPPNLEITEVGTCGNGRGLKMSVARDIFIPGMNLLEVNALNICIRRKPRADAPSFSRTVAAFLNGSF